MVLCLASLRLVSVLLLRLRSVTGSGVDHKMKTLLGSRKFGDIVFRMCSTNVLLHRAIAFLLALRAPLAKDSPACFAGECLIAPGRR